MYQFHKPGDPNDGRIFTALSRTEGVILLELNTSFTRGSFDYLIESGFFTQLPTKNYLDITPEGKLRPRFFDLSYRR